MKHYYSIDSDFFRKIGVKGEYVLVRYLEKDSQRLKDQFGIASFSGLRDSMLMWSHYTNNQKGICIEY